MTRPNRLCLVTILAVATLFVIRPTNVFTTGPAKAPILLLQSDDRFGAFAGEVLRAEGFNEFQSESLDSSDLTAGYLNEFDVVILTETRLKPSQADLLSNYVRDGGNLIAFRPDKQLAPVFGVSATNSSVAGGYIKIQEDNDIGKGLPSEPLQFHGDADQYDLKSAHAIATLCRDSSSSSDNPAVVRYQFGKGHAIMFTYNLPKSIVLARQGNYQNAGLEK
ncbi:MAG TPA: hypothetical protein VGM62_10545, partial [Chthoniobacterales bacterium]